MTALAKARFAQVVDGADRNGWDVLFNPASLKLAYANKAEGAPADGAPKRTTGPGAQAPRKPTLKLDTELFFDTTDTGGDVRDWTAALRLLLLPKSADDPAPAQVRFRWGRFAFFGTIDSLTETLDFWSAEGVPLRATVALSMDSLDLLTAAPAGAPSSAAVDGGDARGATGAATRAGDPAAGRALATLNGLDSMRLPAAGTLIVTGGVELQAAAGFTAGAGFGISGGVSFGTSASAGVSASAGAFAGLGASKAASLRLDPSRLLPPAAGVGAGASFDVTGRAVASGGGLDANVRGAAWAGPA